MTLPEWLAQQKKLLEAATPGPWEHCQLIPLEASLHHDNASFIASVRTEHARALKIIEKYREELEDAYDRQWLWGNKDINKFLDKLLAYFPED